MKVLAGLGSVVLCRGSRIRGVASTITWHERSLVNEKLSEYLCGDALADAQNSLTDFLTRTLGEIQPAGGKFRVMAGLDPLLIVLSLSQAEVEVSFSEAHASQNFIDT